MKKITWKEDSIYQTATFNDANNNECVIGEDSRFNLLLGVTRNTAMGEHQLPMRIDADTAEELAGVLLFYAINGIMPGINERDNLRTWVETLVSQRKGQHG